MSDWLDALGALRRKREAAVLVTVAAARGHAPREAGAKMVVGAAATWGSIGGGNLEETAIARARSLLSSGSLIPVQVEMSLSDKARTEHGRQCCGGEVSLLLEPVPVRPAVAIFGLGHVGQELARVLVRHDVELHLVDSRASYVSGEAIAPLLEGPATVVAHHAPLPEITLGELRQHPLGIGVLAVDLVEGHDDGHVGRTGMIEGLDRLRHQAVVSSDHEHNDVGCIGTASTHLRKRSVAGSVEERD